MRAAAFAILAGWICAAGCGREADKSTTLRFWAMGREGEVVEELAREFEQENPGIAIEVQQIPWTAAHEKLLTAFVGKSTPDLAQLGNTWVSEFVQLNALDPLGARVAASTEVKQASYFPGVWDTNVIDGELYGLPWYVDTRVLFYRRDVLQRAGYDSVPATWDEWKRAMQAMKRELGAERYPILLPMNEWVPVAILGLQAGSPLLADDATRGAFRDPPFRHAFEWYVDLFREGLAPPVRDSEIANLYQEFARSSICMYITGPWNMGEFQRRLPPELQNAWATAPLPSPDAEWPGASVAGGSSLVLFKRSEHHEAAWRFVEFLSRPEQQIHFHHLSGDLPARIEAWSDSGLANDPHVQAFRVQLGRAVPTPKIPEWEQIASLLQERTELAVRGGTSIDETLTIIDTDANKILEKRRWILERARHAGKG
ncbi:MAG TPA: sugar ABC transporter substrate-binding protein [bacterium]|nr:sugar ABC transporter substrate-binding protein [bacterium]